MKDEHFMRAWNDGHDHFSADITRGLAWLWGPVRHFGQWIAFAMRPRRAR